jgi:hypothetical protein
MIFNLSDELAKLHRPPAEWLEGDEENVFAAADEGVGSRLRNS